MRGRDLDVPVTQTVVHVPIFDAPIGEVDLVIEVRELVFVRPLLNLVTGAIGMAVVAVAIPIARAATAGTRS